MRLAAPREASSTHISGFQSASSQLRALRWGVSGRAKEAKAWAGAGLPQGKDPQHKFSLSLTGAGVRGRKLWQTSRKPLGSSISFPIFLQPGAHRWSWTGRGEKGQGWEPSPSIPNSEGPELRSLASKLPVIHHPYHSKSHPQLLPQGQAILRPLHSHPNLQTPGSS